MSSGFIRLRLARLTGASSTRTASAWSGHCPAATADALAAAELLRDEENNVVRDVRVAFLKARHAHERLALTAKLFDHARASHDLARARYNLGASSIAELSQAQLNLTSAEIARTSARYECLALRAELDFLRRVDRMVV